MPKVQRLLVLSDLHAVVGGKHEDETYLTFGQSGSDFGVNLIRYLKGLEKTIDLIICPGDIAHKAEKGAFRLGWTLLNEIRNIYPRSSLLAVPGNHDYESRSDENIDPKTTMQFAEPRFPLSKFVSTTHFWAWNWFVDTTPTHNALMLNTCAYHGLRNESLEHGRVIPEVQKQIIDHIKSDRFPARDINYLLCHHHPVNLPSYSRSPDHQMIDGGQELVDAITAAVPKGAWMIIHGHRHFPAVWYAQSQTSAPPVVFSAGTLAAKLDGELLNRTRNQFYIVEVDLELTRQTGIPTGVFETHEYVYHLGWSLSTSANLPKTGGFGARITPTQLTDRIVELIGVQRIADEETRLRIQTEIRHLTPLDLKTTKELLELRSIVIELDGNQVVQVGRRK